MDYNDDVNWLAKSTAGVGKSSPGGPLSCKSEKFPCFSTPDSNEWTVNGLVQTWMTSWWWSIHLNLLCWSRKTSKTCRTVALEDWDLPPLIFVFEQIKVPVYKVPKENTHLLKSTKLLVSSFPGTTAADVINAINLSLDSVACSRGMLA